MDGVQILNQVEVVVDSVFSWQHFWIGLAIGAGIGLAIAIFFGISEFEWAAFLIALAVSVPTLGCILGFLCGACVREPVKYETRYEVSINEEVNMQEFMNKYEILETRGAIYTVREKDNYGK